MSGPQQPTLIDPKTGQEFWKQQPGTKNFDPNGDPTKRQTPRWLSNWQTINKYTQDLAMALRRAGYLVDPDYSLSQDADAIDKMMRDPIINFAVNFRKRKVAGRDWSLEPAHERYKPYATIFTDLLKRIRKFTQSRFVLAEAVFQGRSAARFDGCVDYLRLEDTNKYLQWWYPQRLLPIDKRRLRTEFVAIPRADGLVDYKYTNTLFDPEQRAWYVIKNPDWYFWFTYNDEEERLGHGKGLYDALYVPWYMKSHALQYGLQWLERWAEPWIDIALEAEAGDSDGLAARADAYIELIKQMRAGRVLVHDNRDRMDLKDAGSGSQDIIHKYLDRLDEAIVRVCLASTLTTGTAQSGTRALGEVHEESQENAINYDRMVFEEEHDTHLLRACWVHNRQNLFRLGYSDVPWECPLRFKLANEQRWKPEEQEKVFRLAADLKVPGVRREDFFTRFGLTEASPGDPVLDFAQAAANVAAGGSMPPFFKAQATRTEQWLA